MEHATSQVNNWKIKPCRNYFRKKLIRPICFRGATLIDLSKKTFVQRSRTCSSKWPLPSLCNHPLLSFRTYTCCKDAWPGIINCNSLFDSHRNYNSFLLTADKVHISELRMISVYPEFTPEWQGDDKSALIANTPPQQALYESILLPSIVTGILL